MRTHVALLRAVNVGGTGKLPMAELARMAEAVGFRAARTYIASGNLLFESDAGEREVKARLEEALAAYAGKHVGVTVRTAEEMAAVLAANPFPDRPANRTAVFFLDAAPPAGLEMVGPGGEEVRAGVREIYVYYPDGMGRSKLKLPAAKGGTARNMNTVAKLVALSSP